MNHIQNCTEDAEPDWSRIERDYVAGARSVAEIAAEVGLAPHMLSAEARRRGWPMRNQHRKPKSRQGLATRLKKLIEAEIEDVEGRLPVDRSAADRERDARRLASLVSSLGKLYEIERDQSKGRKTPLQKGDGDALVLELEGRLARLVAAGDKAGLSKGTETA